MKIVFICGSIEPGKDGVGDYTRRLAGEMIRQGYKASILSINDKDVTNSCEEVQEDYGTKIQTLRLPSNKNYSQKIESAKEFVELINPDWLCLQYVPFSFHPKGLHFGLADMLTKIGKGRKWHIMFHELWCGMQCNVSIKVKLLGWLQKCLIRLTFIKLKPLVVLTNIAYYQIQLNKIGILAKLVPVFGNISLTNNVTDEEWCFFLDANQLKYIFEKKENIMLVGFFGTIYKIPGFNKLLKNLIDYSIKKDKRIFFLVIGNNIDSNIEKLVNQSENINIIKIGFLSEGILNKVLLSTDFGIMTTTANGLNKSGSALAWVERGIPLLVSGDDLFYDESEMRILGIYQIKTVEDIDDVLLLHRHLKNNDRLKYSVQSYLEIMI